MKKIFLLLLFFSLAMWAAPHRALASADRLLILCYHDIPKTVKNDLYGVDQQGFVQQIEYLRTHGYHFVSVEDVQQARDGKAELPAKPVLLTFDDAYESYYSFVQPLLKLYGYPSMLAVVTSWIDQSPGKLPAPLMTWDMIREVAASGLVTVASHSHDLHHGVVYNPYGNTGWAASSRIYDKDKNSYETEDAFRERLRKDLGTSRDLLKSKAGLEPTALVWPYGQYNEVGMEEARALGFDIAFTLMDTLVDVHSTQPLPRVLVVRNPSILDFIQDLKRDFIIPQQQRVVQVDLDQIYDADQKQLDRNLDALIERLYKMKPSTVYLQAFSDDAGTGNIASVYFPNRVLPMKADLFNRVTNQLSIRGIEVYAWLPMLSVVLPDKEKTEKLRVWMWDAKGKRVSSASYQRLSPFSSEVAGLMKDLYADMAANARISGVVFLDDGYLNDHEDFSPAAIAEYRKITGGEDVPFEKLTPQQRQDWTARRTGVLNALSVELMTAVRKCRPQAKFARTIYAPVLAQPKSVEWFSQDYAQSLKLYDQVVVMAYPYMEGVRWPDPWLRKLIQKAKEYPEGLDKTVFKLQSYDWRRKHWVDAKLLVHWMRIMVAEGARHVGYYPDDSIKDRPVRETVKMMMSTETFPLPRIPQSSVEDPYR